MEEKRYLALLAEPRFNRTAIRHLKKNKASCMLLFYKFARYFIPGFHSDNVKNDIKLAVCGEDVNTANDISKKYVGNTHL